MLTNMDKRRKLEEAARLLAEAEWDLACSHNEDDDKWDSLHAWKMIQAKYEIREPVEVPCDPDAFVEKISIDLPYKPSNEATMGIAAWEKWDPLMSDEECESFVFRRGGYIPDDHLKKHEMI